MIRLSQLLKEVYSKVVTEYSDEEKGNMGIPPDAVARGGKWYQGQEYVGKVVGGKFVAATPAEKQAQGGQQQAPPAAPAAGPPAPTTPAAPTPPSAPKRRSSGVSLSADARDDVQNFIRYGDESFDNVLERNKEIRKVFDRVMKNPERQAEFRQNQEKFGRKFMRQLEKASAPPPAAPSRSAAPEKPTTVTPDEKTQARTAAIGQIKDESSQKYYQSLSSAIDTGNFAEVEKANPEFFESLADGSTPESKALLGSVQGEFKQFEREWDSSSYDDDYEYGTGYDNAPEGPGGHQFEERPDFQQWATVKLASGDVSDDTQALLRTAASAQLDADLAYELRNQQASATNENHTSLKKLMLETALKTNRVNLMKIGTLMEKITPELNKNQSKKVTELFTEISMMATQLNVLPYTKFNAEAWELLIFGTNQKLMELKEEVAKIASGKQNINCAPLLKALDEAILH